MIQNKDKKNMLEKTLDLDRAHYSLIEELESVNWYQQRIDATKDTSVEDILLHNRDE